MSTDIKSRDHQMSAGKPISTINHHIDPELQNIIYKRIDQKPSKLLVVGTGITSSHLGDERNLREFLLAGEVVTYLRNNNHNTLFILIDDSYDPLNLRQLRVAVNKDELLISKFEKYCGKPIKLIPDPYDCHLNYSAHFQEAILTRFHEVGIYPNLIDTHSAYESGLYDIAKEIFFKRYEEIKSFLKEKFPSYAMKKLFYPLCPECHMLEGVELTEISGNYIHIHCDHCKKSSSHTWKRLKGKFSWKIDTAVKWNIYQTDFEPFSKAYLDPDVGSYFISKALSKQFFGGNSPVIIEYGQVIMDKSFSYSMLRGLPLAVFRMLYLQHRKSDIRISTQKMIHIAKQFQVDDNLTYYDYIHTRLPYDLLEQLNGRLHDPLWQQLLIHGQEFSRRVLKREVHPQFPTAEMLYTLTPEIKQQTRKLLLWTLNARRKQGQTFTDFTPKYLTYLSEHKIKKTELFPLVRKLLSQENGVPLHRLLFFVPNHYLYACLALLDETRENTS